MTTEDWGATIAAGGGLGVATAEELVATSFVGAAAVEEFVLGTIPAGAVVGLLRLAGFSEVTSSLAVGCDEGRAAATVVAGLLLLLLAAATDAVVTEAPATDALEIDVAAGVVGWGMTEGLVGGGSATAAVGGVALLIMLLSGTTDLSFGLGTLLRGGSVLVFLVELEI